MRSRLFVALLVLALGAIGCVPSVQLRSAMMRGPEAGGVRFDALMTIDNPNGFAIQVRSVTANVRVENVRGTIPVRYDPNIMIGPHRKVTVAVPVLVPWALVPQIAAQSVSKPSVSYTVRGRAHVTAQVLVRMDQSNYEFDDGGELPRSMFLQSNGLGWRR